jgi:hypothetical protein
MRRRRQIALCCLPFLVFPTGCGDTVQPEGKIVVSAEVKPASIPPGQAMNVAVTVVNVSDAAWNLSTKCFGVFEVLDLSGAVVGPATIGCSFDLTPPDLLGPNATLKYAVTWRGESRATTDSVTAYLPAGSYLLRPRVKIGSGNFIYGPTVPVTIQSGPSTEASVPAAGRLSFSRNATRE